MIINEIGEPVSELKDLSYNADRCGCIADILAEISRTSDTVNIYVEANRSDVEDMIKRYKDKYGEDDYNLNPYYIRTLESLLASFGEKQRMAFVTKVPKFRR